MKELLPEGAVRQKMTADGFSQADIDSFLSGKVSTLPLPGQQPPVLGMVNLHPPSQSTSGPNSPLPSKPANLLDEILSGPKLKSVQVEAKPATKVTGAGGILGMLAQEMSKRRVNITTAEEDSDSDSSGFSDSDDSDSD